MNSLLEGALRPVAAALRGDDHVVRIVATRALHTSFGTLSQQCLPGLKVLRAELQEAWRAQYAEIYKSMNAASHNPRSSSLACAKARIRTVLEECFHPAKKREK